MPISEPASSSRTAVVAEWLGSSVWSSQGAAHSARRRRTAKMAAVMVLATAALVIVVMPLLEQQFG